MKKILIITRVSLVLLFIALTINVARLLIEENIDKNIVFGEKNNPANMFEISQGNYVLYTEDNGIETAPFIWGQKIYLYSIRKDKSYLIKMDAGLYDGYGSKMMIYGETIFYEFSEFPEKLTMKSLKINGSDTLALNDPGMLAGGFSVYNDAIYISDYLVVENNNVRNYPGISKVSIADGKIEEVLKGNQEKYNYFVIKNDMLIARNDEEREIEVIDLITGKALKFPFGKTEVPECFEIMSNNQFLSIDTKSGDVVTYDLDTNERRIIGNIMDKPHQTVSFDILQCKVRHNALYSNDPQNNIVKINTITGEMQQLINVSQFAKVVRRCTVSYCTDYISMEIIYNNKDNEEIKELRIYYYTGELKKIIRLKHHPVYK